MININSKVFIAGHNGMLGSSILRELKKRIQKIITIDRKKLDLRNQNAVKNLLKIKNRSCNCCGSKVGGIKSNIKYPAEILLVIIYKFK